MIVVDLYRRLCRRLPILVLALIVVGMLPVMSAQVRAQRATATFVHGQPVFTTRSGWRRLRKSRSAQRENRRIRRQATLRRRASRRRNRRPKRARVGVSQQKPLAGLAAKMQKFDKTSVLQLVMSLKRQELTVYRGQTPVAQSKVSTGKTGHVTPKGIFSIIQKRRFHRSNIYSGAPMPFMQRITWSGIALHLGRLPGYAASHGCVRLPSSFAKHLFKTTRMRTHVVIADEKPVLRAFSHPNLFQASDLDLHWPSTNAATAAAVGMADASQRRSTLVRVNVENVARPTATGMSDIVVGSLQPLSPEDNIVAFDRLELRAHRLRTIATRDSSSPLRILVTRRTSFDRAIGVQRRLIQLGYEIGEADGQFGPLTIGALKDFQRGNGLKVSGAGDGETRELLAERTGMPWPSDAAVLVRQKGSQIYSGTVTLIDGEKPLGTHLYTLVDAERSNGASAWTAMTLQAKGRLPRWTRRQWRKQAVEPMTAQTAIARVRFPSHVRAAIEDRLTPGSSLIIADRGSRRETGLTTDFIVLTD